MRCKMALIALKCPHCNGDIQFDAERNFGFCNYCGSKIMRDDVLTANVNINNDQEVRSCIELAAEAFRRGDLDKCCEYVERARTLNNSFADSFYLLAACHKYDSLKSKEYLVKAQGCASSLDIFGKQDFDEVRMYGLTIKIEERNLIPIPKETTISIDGNEPRTLYGSGIETTFYVFAGSHDVKVSSDCVVNGNSQAKRVYNMEKVVNVSKDTTIYAKGSIWNGKMSLADSI